MVFSVIVNHIEHIGAGVDFAARALKSIHLTINRMEEKSLKVNRFCYASMCNRWLKWHTMVSPTKETHLTRSIVCRVLVFVFSLDVWSGQTFMWVIWRCLSSSAHFVGRNFHYIFFYHIWRCCQQWPRKAINWWQTIELHLYTLLLINRHLVACTHNLWPFSCRPIILFV